MTPQEYKKTWNAAVEHVAKNVKLKEIKIPDGFGGKSETTSEWEIDYESIEKCKI